MGRFQQAGRDGVIPREYMARLPDLTDENAVRRHVRKRMYDPVYVPLVNPQY